MNQHRRTDNFRPGGGGRPFAQKILASCPNFYKTVEKKRGSVITKCDSVFYYKERQVLLQSATILLQSVIGITN